MAIVKTVSQLGCVSQDSDALVSQGRKSRETRRRKSWNQFKGYDSQSLGYVKRVHREKKGPSLGKIQVKSPHQRSPHAMKFEDPSHEETERQRRCVRSKAWNLAKNIFKLKENDKATFYSPAEKWVMPVTSIKEPEEREFVVDSGASVHIVSKRDLNSAELETMWTSRSPTTVMTANGEVQTREEATVFVKELDLFVTVMLLEETPAVLSLGKLCEDHVSSNHWTSGQKPHLIRNGKKFVCNISNFVPFVVPGLLTSSSSPTSSSIPSPSSSQESTLANRENRYLENPVSERSGGTNGELLEKPAAWINNKKNKKEGRREVQSDLLHDLSDWLQEFREILVDESTSTELWVNPEQGSQDTSKSSHELPMEPRAKVEPGSGTHSENTHFPKDPNCDICLKTKITRVSCRRRTGTVVPRTEHVGDLITADHKILSKESESRNNHRHAVEVQDLATQCLQPHPPKTKTFSGNTKELAKVLGAEWEA